MAERLPGLQEMLSTPPTQRFDAGGASSGHQGLSALSEAALRIQQFALHNTTEMDMMNGVVSPKQQHRHQPQPQHQPQHQFQFLPQAHPAPSAPSMLGAKRALEFDAHTNTQPRRAFLDMLPYPQTQAPASTPTFKNLPPTAIATNNESPLSHLTSRLLSSVSAQSTTASNEFVPSLGKQQHQIFQLGLSTAPRLPTTTPTSLLPQMGDSPFNEQAKLQQRKHHLFGQLAHLGAVHPSQLQQQPRLEHQVLQQQKPLLNCTPPAAVFSDLRGLSRVSPPTAPSSCAPPQIISSSTSSSPTSAEAPQGKLVNHASIVVGVAAGANTLIPQDPPKRRRRTPSLREGSKHIQCIGVSQKKNERCRNAALMDYIGPRPLYCAEHVHLDEHALYQKCAAVMEVDFKHKYCKEVVLKEFSVCFKHLPAHLNAEMNPKRGQAAKDKCARLATRAKELLQQLQQEAAAARQSDADLFQRKVKLIPKYQAMVQILDRHLQQLSADTSAEATEHAEPAKTLASNTETPLASGAEANKQETNKVV